MSEWWTYRLSDFLLFSPRTYYRLFELHHQATWPAQLAAVAIAIVIAALLQRHAPWRARVIAALLAACWLWVAIAFHLRRYSTINLAAQYFAGLFVVQGVLLFWSGVVRATLTFPRPSLARYGTALFLCALVAWPLAGRAAGRAWREVEMFGVTPDATAVATLALIVTCSKPIPRVLLVLPLSWLLVTGATLWALGSPEAWLVVLVGVAVVVETIRQRAISPRS